MTIGKILRAIKRAHLHRLALMTVVSGLSVGAPALVSAGSLTATVTDANGLLLEHAIVSLLGNAPETAPQGTQANIDQRSRRFAPTVLPIQTGTTVSFPNTDDVRHHVYSFSQPNSFELKLYHGEPSNKVLFDAPGIVVLGCNIHDGMVGYLMVVDTPWFGTTAANGKTRIENLSAGKHILQVWHPDLGGRVVKKALKIGEGDSSVAISLKTPTSLRNEEATSPLQALFED